MGKDERTRYSDEELKEFEVIILEKLEKAQSLGINIIDVQSLKTLVEG